MEIAVGVGAAVLSNGRLVAGPWPGGTMDNLPADEARPEVGVDHHFHLMERAGAVPLRIQRGYAVGAAGVGDRRGSTRPRW